MASIQKSFFPPLHATKWGQATPLYFTPQPITYTPAELQNLYEKGLKYANPGKGYHPAWALTCFERTAKQGHVLAQYELGLIYEQGLLDIAPHHSKARAWYQTAADQGCEDARYVLQDHQDLLKLQTPPVSQK